MSKPPPKWMADRGITPKPKPKQPAVPTVDPLGEGVGTELTLICKEEYGIPSCQQCRDLAKRMNEWGPDGCREHMEEIVDDIKPRADAWLSRDDAGWIDKLKTKAPDFAKRHEIRKLVNRAIERWESKQRENPTDRESASVESDDEQEPPADRAAANHSGKLVAG